LSKSRTRAGRRKQAHPQPYHIPYKSQENSAGFLITRGHASIAVKKIPAAAAPAPFEPHADARHPHRFKSIVGCVEDQFERDATDDSTDHQPAVLNYATAAAPDPPGWPIGIYLAALAWAYITLSLVTQSRVAPPWQKRLERFQLRVQLVVLTCAAIRLAWAVYRKDKSRGWILYVVLLALAAPFWMLMEFIGPWGAGGTFP
jgi:hypothetical protein